MTRLAGKVAPVAGASSGIGRARARPSAARRKDELDRLVARSVAAGGRAAAPVCPAPRRLA